MGLPTNCRADEVYFQFEGEERWNFLTKEGVTIVTEHGKSPMIETNEHTAAVQLRHDSWTQQRN